MTGFWVGGWLHDAPDTAFSTGGKRAVVKHVCFGPLETKIWYADRTGQYCCEHCFIEGLQAGEQYVEAVSRADMLDVIKKEIMLCKTYGEPGLTVLFQAEQEKMENDTDFI